MGQKDFVHSSDENIICQLIGCEKSFKNNRLMKSHFKLHFDRENNFVCLRFRVQFKIVSICSLLMPFILTNDQ